MNYIVIYKRPRSGKTIPITVFECESVMEASKRAKTKALNADIIKKGYNEYGIFKEKPNG